MVALNCVLVRLVAVECVLNQRVEYGFAAMTNEFLVENPRVRGSIPRLATPNFKH